MTIPLFDSHCHLTDKKFDVDRENIINGAEKDGLFMITIGASYKESVKAIELANKYPKNIWATVGVHPEYAREVPENISELLESILKEQEINPPSANYGGGGKKVVAVGEGGLDYSNLQFTNFQFSNNLQIPIFKKESEIIEKQNGSAELTTSSSGALTARQIIEKQKKLFKIQLHLALKYDLPIIMHLRSGGGEVNGFNAYKDALEILDSLPKMPRGVVHFFQGNLEQAQEFLKRGFYLGFDGYITFDFHYDDIIKEIPLDRILIETDSPYVAPIPFRGKRNEPKFAEYVAEKIAQVKGMSTEEIKRATYDNVRALFNVNEDVNEVELR